MYMINGSSVSVSSRCFGSLMVWSIQVCVNAMPRRKDISNDLEEVNVAANQCGKHYKAIIKLFQVHHTTMRKIFHKQKALKTASSLSRIGDPSKSTPNSEKLQKTKELHLGHYSHQLACYMLKFRRAKLDKGWTNMTFQEKHSSL